MSVLDLARPDILAMAGYSSARLEAGAGRVFLNANESPQAPIPGADCNRYPEPQPHALITALASLYGVKPAQCLVGRGSDEAIDLLTRAFCQAGHDPVLVSTPTFGMYAICARVQGAPVIDVPLLIDQGFAYPVDDVCARLSDASLPTPKLIYVCTPNNPTGNPVPLAVIRRLLAATAGKSLLIVDEAYVEFSEEPSVIDLLDSYEHLVVLRTLSKAHGLAGERIGVCLAAPAIIALLRKIMAPYPLPSSSVRMALSVLSSSSRRACGERIRVAISERARLAERLTDHPLVRSVLPSNANFLAVLWHDADGVYAELMSAGIVLRQLQKYPGLSDALRISIGTPAENNELLDVLDARARRLMEAA